MERKTARRTSVRAMPQRGSMTRDEDKRIPYLKIPGGILGAWVREIKNIIEPWGQQKPRHTGKLRAKEKRESVHFRNCLGILNKAATRIYGPILSGHKTIMRHKVVGSEPAYVLTLPQYFLSVTHKPGFLYRKWGSGGGLGWGGIFSKLLSSQLFKSPLKKNKQGL